MTGWIDRRGAVGFGLAILFGMAFFLALERREEPDLSAIDTVFELVEIAPLVVVSAGLVLLARVASRQRDEQRTLMR